MLLLKSTYSTDKPAVLPAENIADLVFPVSFALANPQVSVRENLPALNGPYLTRAARTEAHPNLRDDVADAWQMRVDMTLADAEDLVEGLRSLIAAAKDGLQTQNATQPTALALAGLKIGAEPKAAAPRFSPAQLEALSRLPVRRGLSLGPDGRVVHSLNTRARLHPRLASPSRG